MVEIRMGMHCKQCPIDRFIDSSKYTTQRLFRLQELEQEIDKVRELIHSDSYFAIKLFTLRRIKTVVTEELRIGNHCGEWCLRSWEIEFAVRPIVARRSDAINS